MLPKLEEESSLVRITLLFLLLRFSLMKETTSLFIKDTLINMKENQSLPNSSHLLLEKLDLSSLKITTPNSRKSLSLRSYKCLPKPRSLPHAMSGSNAWTPTSTQVKLMSSKTLVSKSRQLKVLWKLSKIFFWSRKEIWLMRLKLLCARNLTLFHSSTQWTSSQLWRMESSSHKRLFRLTSKWS